jgi:hypothetical protein
MGPVLPVAVAALAGLAWYRASHSTYGKMTPERQIIYETAFKTLKDGKALRTLAGEFDKEGLGSFGDMLRKRAALREMPEETRLARREAFKKGMNSTNAAAIENLAQAFISEGAIGSAEKLRAHIASLSTSPSTPPPEEQPNV